MRKLLKSRRCVYSAYGNNCEKDKSVKIALDARALNQSLAKDKYQMPNLDILIDSIARRGGVVFLGRHDVRVQANSPTRANKMTLQFSNS